jgi:hypothetical protein
MSVQVAPDGTVMLDGVCGADEAELLQQLLLRNPAAAVDWRGCEQVHTAIIQVLLVANRPLRGPPASAFLADRIAPLLLQKAPER